jgi:F0F1-type ATP synthase epsilon subunit
VELGYLLGPNSTVKISMALAYRQPGVSVDEVVTPQISPLLAAPALVCLVGPTQGYQTRTDQFVLSGTTATPLPGLPVGASLDSVTAVKDALDPSQGNADGSGYTLTTDYTVSTVNGTITRVGAGAIATGTLVNVTYRFVPSDYYEPTYCEDLGTVETRYGSALSADGLTINSPVSYAASLAFENGASSVVVQPLFARTTPGDPTSVPVAPDATATAALATWQDTLYVLRDIEDINVIVPIIGQSTTNVGDATLLTLFQAVQDHIYFMSSQDQYLISVNGEDSSADATKATAATIQGHANTLRGRYGGAVAEQTVLINTAKFKRSLPVYGKTLLVGGQYMAAAISGMLASRPVSSSLTRKIVSGFIQVEDTRDLNEKNADAAAGLLVVENSRGNVVVRHAITLDQTSAARRELSVVRAKHRMIESVRDTLDRQIVGHIIADGQATATVRSTVIGVLEQLRQGRDLVDYQGVEAKLVSLDPTTVQVRFSYRPSFPLNYVDVKFSIDMSAGTVTTGDQGSTTL